MNNTILSRIESYRIDMERRIRNIENISEYLNLHNEFTKKSNDFLKEVNNAINIDSANINEIVKYICNSDKLCWLYDTANRPQRIDSVYNSFGIILSIDDYDDFNILKIVVSKIGEDRGYAIIMIHSDNDCEKPGINKVKARISKICAQSKAFDHFFDHPIDFEFELDKFYKNNFYPLSSKFGKDIFNNYISIDALSAFIFNILYLFIEDTVKTEMRYIENAFEEHLAEME